MTTKACSIMLVLLPAFDATKERALLNGPTQIHGQRFRAANFDGGYDT
jgi:hypothetical protein